MLLEFLQVIQILKTENLGSASAANLVSLIKRNFPKVRSSYGLSLPHLWAWDGQLELLKDLSSFNLTFVDWRNAENSTTLHLGTRSGHLEVVKYLLETGESSSAQDINGWTPLHFAVWNNQLEIAELLVAKDPSSVDLQNGLNFTALHLAVFNCNYEMIKFLTEAETITETETRFQLRTFGDWTQLNIAASRCQVYYKG
jgi:ankyrin repeat protein